MLGSIDDAFLSLGEAAKQSIYLHIESNYKIPRNEIPENLKQFHEGLEKIFGIGASYLEILIMKNLYAKIGHNFTMEKNNQLEFVKYVEATKRSFINDDPETKN